MNLLRLFRRTGRVKPRNVAIRYSIGSNIRDNRMEMSLEIDGGVLNQIISQCYLEGDKPVFEMSGVTGAVVLVDWEEFKARTEDFFQNRAPEPDPPVDSD